MAIHEGDKVELLAGKESVYPRALLNSRGTVHRTKVDEDGFEQVYVVWDREEWRYNGEKDGWTFADHFRVIEEAEILPTAEELDVPPTIDSYDEAVVAEYLDTLMLACDKASESDAFFFVMLKRDEQDRVHFEVMGASIDDDLMNLSVAEVFKFVEGEMRRREE